MMIFGRLGRLVLLVLLVLCLTQFLWSEKLGILEGIYKPGMMKVYDGDLFVVEGHRVFIYSLENLKLKKVIGKKGDGPGEYKLDPSRTLIISVLSDQIIAESRYKVVSFSREGDYLKEYKKTNFSTLQILPLKDNFLVYHYKSLDPDKNQTYFFLSIYDQEMKPIKEIHRQKFFSFEDKAFLMPDGINFCLHLDQVFVEKSTEGFVVEVYDSIGNQIRRIEKPFKKIKISKAAKEAAYNDYITIPSLKRLRKERGEEAFKNLLNSLKFVYPEFYAPIKDIAIGKDLIYVRTPKIMQDSEEYLLMDFEGRILRKTSLPIPKKIDFLVQMQGDKKYYNINNNKFYYLKLVASEDDEDWEVHVVDIF